MYVLYILQCADKTLYTGVTSNVARRLREHNASGRGAKYTRPRRPVKLVYSRMFRSRSTAQQEEHRIKQRSRRAKLTMIANVE